MKPINPLSILETVKHRSRYTRWIVFAVAWSAISTAAWVDAQKPPHVVQRERNPFIDGNWALSKRGNVLVTSTGKGTHLHFWTRDKYVSLNRPIDATRFDLAQFTWRSDHLVLAKSESIEAYRQMLKQVRQSVRYSPAALDAYEKAIDAAYDEMADNPKGLENRLSEIRKKFGIEADANSTGNTAPGKRGIGKPSAQAFDIIVNNAPTRTRMTRFGTIEAKSGTGRIVFSGEGNRAALIDATSNAIERVDLQSGFNAPNRRFEDVLLPGPIFDAIMTARGGQLLAIQLGRVVLVDMEEGRLIQAMEIDPLWSDVHFAFQGRYIVAKEVGDRAQVVIVQTRTGRTLRFDIEPEDRVTVTPDGRWLVRLSGNEVIFQKLADRNEVYREMLHDDCFRDSQMCFAAERGRMVIWSDEPARMYVLEYPFKRIE